METVDIDAGLYERGAPYKREIEALRVAFGDRYCCPLFRHLFGRSGLAKDHTKDEKVIWLDYVIEHREAECLQIPELVPFMQRRVQAGYNLPLTRITME